MHSSLLIPSFASHNPTQYTASTINDRNTRLLPTHTTYWPEGQFGDSEIKEAFFRRFYVSIGVVLEREALWLCPSLSQQQQQPMPPTRSLLSFSPFMDAAEGAVIDLNKYRSTFLSIAPMYAVRWSIQEITWSKSTILFMISLLIYHMYTT